MVLNGWLNYYAVPTKRVLRIWRREGLKVPIRKVKKSRLWLENGRSTRLMAERPNHVWAYDFT